MTMNEDNNRSIKDLNLKIEHEVIITLWILIKPFQFLFSPICFIILVLLYSFVLCRCSFLLQIFALILTAPLQILWFPIYIILWIIAQFLVRVCKFYYIARCANEETLLDDTSVKDEILFMPYTMVMIPFLGERD